MRMTASRRPPAADADLYAPELYSEGEPHSVWRHLRETAPVRRHRAPDGTPFWSVSTHREVSEVLKDHASYSSAHGTMLDSLGGDPAGGKAIHLTDPPDHTPLRRGTIATLSTGAMRRRSPLVRERVTALVETALEQGRIDAAEWVAALPMLVVGDVLGLPEASWADATRWAQASLAPQDPAYLTSTPEQTLLEAHLNLLTLFTEVVAERRRRPGDDLVSALLEVEIDGKPLDDEHVLANCYGFLIGATSTTPHVAAHLIAVLAEHPEIWRRVRSDPSLAPGLLDEANRWATPVNHLLRRTTAEVRLGGRKLPPGALVCAWLASANRDERVFADPFRFDPSRSPNPHLAFGSGVHRCVGDPAGRLGLALLVEALAERVGSLEQIGPARHLRSNFLNGITNLPVILHPPSTN
ncbi:MAG TPA: cytochrome P450 [Glycomyces sp.]|nr:cytochrome P450 [Glycomyces sp.]